MKKNLRLASNLLMSLLIPGHLSLLASHYVLFFGFYLLASGTIVSLSATRCIADYQCALAATAIISVSHILFVLFYLLQKNIRARLHREFSAKNTAITALSISFLLLYATNIELLSGIKVLRVAGASMSPELRDDEIIVIDTWLNHKEVKPCNIIVFRKLDSIHIKRIHEKPDYASVAY